MYDLIVIGAGPGGYHAAIHAAQEGLQTALVEKNRLGGVCLQEGCIPTKSLVHSAEVLRTCTEAHLYGVDIDACTVNWKAVQKRKETVVTQLTKGLEQLVPANGVELIYGEAVLTDRIIGSAREVTIRLNDGTETALTAKNIIIATGSVPAVPPIPGINLPGIIGSREALELLDIPEKLLIVGGGIIGMEFASIYASFGSQVTVVEYLPQIMTSMDGEIAKRIEIELKRSKIKIHTGSQVTEIKNSKDLLAATVTKGDIQETVLANAILLSTGRKPNIQGLGLEQAGINFTDNSGIKVNMRMQTNVEGVYAIGDVAGNYLLAHVAAAEGMTAVDNILGNSREMNYDAVPSAVFTYPETAAVGLTEETAKEQGIAYKTTKFMFGGNSRAVTIGANRGIVKIITTITENRIIGAHIIGPNASELIHELVLAIKLSLTAEDIAHTIHAHPTLSEAVMETAQGVFGRFTHMIK